VSRVNDGPEQRYADLPFDPATAMIVAPPPTRYGQAGVRRAHAARLGRAPGERLLGEYT
jgi:hypothetical protein